MKNARKIIFIVSFIFIFAYIFFDIKLLGGLGLISGGMLECYNTILKYKASKRISVFPILFTFVGIFLGVYIILSMF